jgi:hypothetical protein
MQNTAITQRCVSLHDNNRQQSHGMPQSMSWRSLRAAIKPLTYRQPTQLSPHFTTVLQPVDYQRLCNMPSFGLQKVAFQRAKGGLLPSDLPCFRVHPQFCWMRKGL